MECPKCGREMEFIAPEPDVGINGGYECECGHGEPAWADEDGEPPMPMEDR